MTVDLELAINLMQAKHRTLASSFPTLYAPDLAAYPTVLDTPNLPCLLTWPAAGRWGQKGYGYKIDNRTMSVLGFVQVQAQNDIPSNAVAAIEFLQAVRNLWITASSIPLAAPDANSGYQITVESSADLLHSDTGIGPNLQFGGKPFIGFIISLNIALLWSVT